MVNEPDTQTQQNKNTTHTLGVRIFLVPFSAALGIFLILGGLIASDRGAFESIQDRIGARNLASASGTTTTEQNVSTPQKDPFADLTLEAEAAYAYDTSTGEILFQKNSQKHLPLASIAKLMTALVAYEHVPPSTTITLSAEDIATDGDSGLLVGEKWRLADLVDYTLLTSSNDGANALATAVGSLGQTAYGESNTVARSDFVGMMNQKAQDLGLEDTYFLNATGLDVNATTSGAYGTAEDVAMFMQHLLQRYPSIVERTSNVVHHFTSLQDVRHTATNTNVNADQLAGLIASKTGYTDLAGGNLVVAFDVDIGRPVILVILGSTYDGRFADMTRVARTVRQAVVQLPATVADTNE